MRLIDADAILEKKFVICDCGDWIKVVEVCDIEDAPTIEAEPVRYGKWIPSESNKPTKIFSCSECKGVIELGHYAYKCYYNYCPNCGAKMDLEEQK